MVFVFVLVVKYEVISQSNRPGVHVKQPASFAGCRPLLKALILFLLNVIFVICFLLLLLLLFWFAFCSLFRGLQERVHHKVNITMSV